MNDIQILCEIVDDVFCYTILVDGEILLKTSDSRVKTYIEQDRIEELVTLLRDGEFDFQM